jgi:hypothetical protein
MDVASGHYRDQPHSTYGKDAATHLQEVGCRLYRGGIVDAIKLATPEQVSRIASTSDLGPTSAVLAMGEDLAVVKQITELDPVYFAPESTTARRLMFIWGIENWLRLTGAQAYYFSVLADPSTETWRHNLETHGAKQQSFAPEIRYGKELINGHKATDDK